MQQYWLYGIGKHGFNLAHIFIPSLFMNNETVKDDVSRHDGCLPQKRIQCRFANSLASLHATATG